MSRYLACTFASLLLTAVPAAAQQKATISGVAEIPFMSVPNFLKLPAGESLGESVAVTAVRSSAANKQARHLGIGTSRAPTV